MWIETWANFEEIQKELKTLDVLKAFFKQAESVQYQAEKIGKENNQDDGSKKGEPGDNEEERTVLPGSDDLNTLNRANKHFSSSLQAPLGDLM